MNNETPEVFVFGCIGSPGHFLHAKRDRSMRWHDEKTPWPNGKMDGGLLTDDYCKADTTPTGKLSIVRKDGWTAVSFWDRSGDSRPGSNTTFLVQADIPAGDLLALAREQWPEVFNREGFPLK